MKTPLILASSSPARRRLLENAGVPFSSVSPNLDETTIKRECQTEKRSASAAAASLALAKAQTVGAVYPKNLILAADQILTLNGRWFDKPRGADGLRNHLRLLSGKKHQLVNSAVIIQGGEPVWQHNKTINMEMRVLDEDFINAYIVKAGKAAYQSVGGYDYEGLGIQLFRRTGGDFFSILGLPLLALLKFLRMRGVLPS